MDLEIAGNIITISVSQAQTGIGQYNTSNLAIFTNEAYDAPSFGDLGYKIYLSPTDVANDFGTESETYAMALAVFSQKPNILAGGGYLVVIPLNSDPLNTAIVRTQDLVQYFGIMITRIMDDTETPAAAAVVQSLNKILFVVQRDETAVQAGGIIDNLTTAGYTQTRGLYYGGADDASALNMCAAYAGRALSTNFSGSNTTQTMHLKDLTGVLPDPSMTQTILNECESAGADVYVSFQGVAKTFTSGANGFFDDVYNLQWFVGALQVAGFNFLAESSTKVPQTEQGMRGLKGAYRQVCEQAVTNQYLAPGSWNSPDQFGNQQDLLDNISQRGYYIYSQPVSQQSQTDRVARKAPLVQIAVKAAGAIHSSDVVVYVNE